MPKSDPIKDILARIDLLSASQKSKLFQLLSRHPDNKLFKKVVKDCQELVKTQEERNEESNKLHELERLISKIEFLEKESKLERSWTELANSYLEEKENYTKGPKKRSEEKQQRHNKIKQLMQTGIKDSGQIRKALRAQGIEVSLKTIRNDISTIRHPKD